MKEANDKLGFIHGISAISRRCTYKTGSLYLNKYGFVYKNVEDREEYIHNKELLELKKTKNIGDIRRKEVEINLFKYDKYLKNKEKKIKKYKINIVCKNIYNNDDVLNFKTLTLAATFFGIKGKHLKKIIESEIPVYNSFYFKYGK